MDENLNKLLKHLRKTVEINLSKSVVKLRPKFTGVAPTPEMDTIPYPMYGRTQSDKNARDKAARIAQVAVQDRPTAKEPIKAMLTSSLAGKNAASFGSVMYNPSKNKVSPVFVAEAHNQQGHGDAELHEGVHRLHYQIADQYGKDVAHTFFNDLINRIPSQVRNLINVYHQRAYKAKGAGFTSVSHTETLPALATFASSSKHRKDMLEILVQNPHLVPQLQNSRGHVDPIKYGKLVNTVRDYWNKIAQHINSLPADHLQKLKADMKKTDTVTWKPIPTANFSNPPPHPEQAIDLNSRIKKIPATATDEVSTSTPVDVDHFKEGFLPEGVEKVYEHEYKQHKLGQLRDAGHDREWVDSLKNENEAEGRKWADGLIEHFGNVYGDWLADHQIHDPEAFSERRMHHGMEGSENGEETADMLIGHHQMAGGDLHDLERDFRNIDLKENPHLQRFFEEIAQDNNDNKEDDDEEQTPESAHESWLDGMGVREGLASIFNNKQLGPKATIETYKNTVYPKWMEKWMPQGFGKTHDRITKLRDRLKNAKSLTFLQKARLLNEAIHETHQTGGMLDHINNYASSHDIGHLDQDFLTSLSNEPKHTRKWDKDLRQLTKNEDLVKYVPDSRLDVLPKSMMGWITPEGEFKPIVDEESHEDALMTHHGFDPSQYEVDAQKLAHNAYNKGWISVGHSEGNNVVTGPEHTFNPTHPALKTLQKLFQAHASELPPQINIHNEMGANVWVPKEHILENHPIDLKTELKKEMQHHQVENSFHGIISPDGRFHPMESHQKHEEVLHQMAFGKSLYDGVPKDDEDGGQALSENLSQNDEALADGWAMVGHMGTPSVSVGLEVLKDRNHPVHKALKKLAKQLPDRITFHTYSSEDGERDMHQHMDAAHFAKHGTLKDYREPERMSSELNKAIFGTGHIPATFHGVIDHTGVFHPMNPSEFHSSKIQEKGLFRNRHDCILVGNGGEPSATIHDTVLRTPNHPAMAKLKEIVAAHPQITTLSINHVPEGKNEWDGVVHQVNAPKFSRYGFNPDAKVSTLSTFKSEKLNYKIYFESMKKTLNKAAPDSPNNYYHILQNGTRITNKPLHIDHIKHTLFGGKEVHQIEAMGYKLLPMTPPTATAPLVPAKK